MVTRTNTKHVTFRRPFSLCGFDSPQSAGTYTVDTEEELLETLSFPAWKRVVTSMQITRGSAMEYLPVDPNELSGALVRDAAQDDLPVSHLVSPSGEARDALNSPRTDVERY